MQIEGSEEQQEEAHVFELKIEDEYAKLTPAYTDKQLETLLDSLREHGQLQPGLVNQDNVILD